MDRDLEDEVYRIVGEEVVRKEYHPGPMAKAVAEGRGNRDMVQSLYVRFRCQDLIRSLEREAVAKREKRKRELEEARRRTRENIFDCPCGFSGKANVVPREPFSMVVLIVGLLLFILPGILYLVSIAGYKAVCPKCGRTLAEGVKP